MSTLADLSVRVGLDASEAESGLKGFAGKVQSNMAQIGEGMTKAGSALTKGVTAPILAVGGAAFKAAMDIDDAMDTIRVGTGATGPALDDLGNSFKTVFKGVPDDAAAVGTAIADLNTRTGATGETLEGMATQMLNLSRISGEDLGATIASTTRVFGDWGIATKDQAGTLDYLFKVSQSTGIGVNDLAQKVVQFGAPLRQVGFDLETSAALMGKWEKEGVNLQTVLGGMKIGLANFAREGIDAKEGLLQTIDAIKNAGSASEATGLAMEVFGARAGPDMAAAIREGRFDLDELLTTLQESPETINAAAEATYDFGENWKMVKNKLAVALEPLGTMLMQTLDDLTPVFERIVGKVTELSEWFSNLSPEAKNLALSIGGIAAAAGPVLLVVGKLATGFSSMMLSVAKFAPMFASMGAGALPVIAVLAGLALVAKHIYDNWETYGPQIMPVVEQLMAVFQQLGTVLMDAFQQVMEAIAPVIPVLMEAFMGMVDALVPAFVSIVEVVAQIATKFAELVPVIVPVVVEIVEVVAGLIEQLAPIIVQIAEVFAQLVTALAPVLEEIGVWVVDFIALIAPIVAEVATIFGEILSAIMPIVQEIVSFIQEHWSTIQSVITTVMEVVRGVVDGAMKIIQGIINVVMGLITGDWSRAWDGIKSIGEGAWNIIKSLAEGAFNALKAALGIIWDGVKALWSAMWDGAKSLWSTAKGWISGIPGEIKGLFADALNWLVDAGKWIVQGLWNGISGAAGWLYDKMTGWVGNVTGFFKGLFGIDSPSKVFAGYGLNMMQGLAAGIDRSVGLVDAALAKVQPNIELDASLSASANVQGARAGTNITIESIVINGGREEAEEAMSVLTTRLQALGVVR